MRMIEDMAHDAFTAARKGDRAAMRATLTDIVAVGDRFTERATRAWMERLLVIIGDPFGPGGQITLKIEMTPDNAGTDETFTLDQVRAELAWVGQMFMSYAMQDEEQLAKLWTAIPAGQMVDYAERLLLTMAKTTLAYEEAAHARAATPPNSVIRAWITSDLQTTGDRLAHAHRN